MPAPTAYKRTIRPVMPNSFPTYVEQELDKIGTFSKALVEYTETISTLEAAISELRAEIEELKGN